MPRKITEILTGVAVIVVAAVFLAFALAKANAVSAGGYTLVARFSSIDGLANGADVKIGGVTVGHVVSERLDPVTYAAVVHMQIENAIQIPSDSSAAVNSSGLLGGDYIGVSPGGSDSMLKPGASFPVTQSAINIEDLLGKFIFGAAQAARPAGGSTPGASSQPSPSQAGPSR